MLREGFPTLGGNGEGRVRATSDELFLALDVPEFFKAPGVAGKIPVREIKQVFERDEVYRFVNDQYRHDSQSRLAFKSLVYIFEEFFHGS